VTISEIQLGQTLLADRAYDSEALLQSLADRGASANVKPMPHRVNIPAFSLYSIALATGLRRNARQQFLGKAQKKLGSTSPASGSGMSALTPICLI
jgi:hypothetical protein